MSFSHISHRLFGVDPILGSTPIHSLTDPWLGIGTQLLPLPQAILRILIVTLPTYGVSVYCLPALIAAFASHYEPEEGEKSFADNVKGYGRLFIDTIKSSERRSIPDQLEKFQLIKKQTNLCFTSRQGRKMQRRFERQARAENNKVLVGKWSKFLQGRNRIVLDDVTSDLTSLSGRTITANHGHDAPRPGHLPMPIAMPTRRRELFEPTGVNQLDQRFFLFTEVEMIQNRKRHLDEMMARLEPEPQVATTQEAAAVMPPIEPSRKGIPANLRTSLASTSREPYHPDQGRIGMQSDADSDGDEVDDILQAQLFVDDTFPPVLPPFNAGYMDPGAGFFIDVLRISDNSPSLQYPRLKRCRVHGHSFHSISI